MRFSFQVPQRIQPFVQGLVNFSMGKLCPVCKVNPLNIRRYEPDRYECKCGYQELM